MNSGNTGKSALPLLYRFNSMLIKAFSATFYHAGDARGSESLSFSLRRSFELSQKLRSLHALLRQ
jgi:hypothetical protein